MTVTKGENGAPSVSALYSQAFNFPRGAADRPGQNYLIATAPRTGSTLLSIHLFKHVGFGLPLEYLNIDRLDVRLASTGTRSVGEYWDHILSHRRDDVSGVFGMKCFANQATFIQLKWPELFETFFLQARVVRLLRRDVLAQAVSLARAFQTSRWFSDQRESRPPVYDRDEITKALHHIQRQNAWWDDLLGRHAVTPLTLYYEDFADAPETAVAATSSLVGIDRLVPRVCRTPDIRTQSDAINLAWVQRYASETQL